MKIGKKFGFLFCLIIPVLILIINSNIWLSSHFETTQFSSDVVLRTNSNVQTPHETAKKMLKPILEERKRTMVVVLAYMHTGSTFLGSILQEHEGAFYEYENLRSLMYSTHAGKVIYFLNGTQRKLTPLADKQNIHHNVDTRIGAEAVRNMITCSNDKLDIATLANHYFTLDSAENKHVKDYFRCQEKEFGSSLQLRAKDAMHYVQNRMLLSNRTETILRKCLPILTQRCQNASLIAEKFIRMTMAMAELLLNDLPDVKIIHLVRDPRAMLDSQIRKGDSGAHIPKVFSGRTQYMCKQMVADLKLAKKLKELHPNRIHTLRYEDLVKDAMPVTQGIFDFLGVPLTTADKNYITKKSRPTQISSPETNRTITGISDQTSTKFKTRNLKSVISSSNKQTQNIPKLTRRRFPTRPLRKIQTKPKSWREHLSKFNMDIVNKYCDEVYDMLGYVKFVNYSDLLDPRKEHFLPINLN